LDGKERGAWKSGVEFNPLAGCRRVLSSYNGAMMTDLLSYTPQPHGPLGISMTYWIIIGASMLISMAVSGMLKHRFTQYSQVPMPLTGAAAAELMLRQNGITDVQVMSVPGQLTDHYDPMTKTVNLSEPVYHAATVSAVAVAAHECGHAVQHQQAYFWLGMRSKLVPAVQFSSRLMSVLMMIGFMVMAFSGNVFVLKIAVALFAMTTLFAFVTLPVEFDASRRALAWIDRSGLGARMEHQQARKALFWAAMTYVVAALGSLAMLLYYINMLYGNRRN
jgi:uncharacterized protein